MKFPEALISATLLKRYKRFLADVELESGEQLTVHTANTGAMTGCAIPGSKIWISNSHNSKRKYLYSWEISSTQEGNLIGINTQLANKLVKEAIEKGFISELDDIQKIDTEVTYGAEKSRIDLLVTQNNGQICYVEVKNVTASFEPGIAAFPDAVTARGTKHLRELELMVQQGHRGIILFCVQRNDIDRVRAAYEIDSVYAETLTQVAANGVEMLAYGADVSPQEIVLHRKLDVIL
jgi:sugar fermentation stimulation protein A